MIKRTLSGFICISFLLLLCCCTNRSSQFYVITEYDYFKDAGDMGFYKKGELYGFINLNGDAAGLKSFALDEKADEAIDLESIECFNGLATFSTEAGVSPRQAGFMDLHGNIVMKPEWEQIRTFGSSGYASVFENKLNKYIIIDKGGRTIRDKQSYIEFYYPDPDIFICRDTFDITNSNSGYYVLDKDLNLLLDDLEVYYKSGPELAHTRQYTILGDDEKFTYKKNNKFYLYDLKSNKIISQFESYDDLTKNQNQFIEECQKTYADHYEHRVIAESYNGVFIHYDQSSDKYLLTDENGKTIFEPDPDITALLFEGKGHPRPQQIHRQDGRYF